MSLLSDCPVHTTPSIQHTDSTEYTKSQCPPQKRTFDSIPTEHGTAPPEYPFEDYDLGEEQYSGGVALLHKKHMQYFYLGYVTSKNFLPETVQDVYINNLYALSWFYDRHYPFDTYESEKDSYLYVQSFLKQRDDKADAALASYTDLI
jgi:hypothetical protein